jgi:glycosyltransferase involved in cell wall biosynthesis
LTANPRISVLVRSCNRPDAVAELLEALRAQEHDSFEVVVIEQTQTFSPEQRARLEASWDDPRVRVFFRPPLGGARARNEGIRNARGDIVILIDDDDLPADAHWISGHESHYKDPRLVGLSARQVRAVGEACPYPRWAYPMVRRLAMRFSFLGIPHISLPRFDEDIDGVDWVNGTNGSVRREVALRVGLWDETVKALEEHSFGYKFSQSKRPGEYLGWRSEPTIVRRLDVKGGMDKRDGDLEKELATQLNFSHRIVRRYRPRRFAATYPLVLASAFIRALAFVWDYDWFDVPASQRLRRTLLLVTLFPAAVKKARRPYDAVESQTEKRPESLAGAADQAHGQTEMRRQAK